jgi:hypothetical protein
MIQDGLNPFNEGLAFLVTFEVAAFLFEERHGPELLPVAILLLTAYPLLDL